MADVGRGVEVLRRVVVAAAAVAVTASVAVLVLPLVIPVQQAERVGAAGVFLVLISQVFAFHLGLAVLALAALAAVCRRWPSVLALAAAGVLLAGPGLASFLRTTPAVPTAKDDAFTVLSSNTLFMEADLDALAAMVESERPDVLMLQEIPVERRGEVLERFGAAFPHRAWTGSHRWGCGLLSRTPFVGEPEEIPGHEAWPIGLPCAGVEFGGRVVRVVSVHLPSPARADRVVAGPEMAASVAGWLGERFGPDDAVVLAGDFNAPLWTASLAPLRGHGLVEAHEAAGWGRGATWPDRTVLKHAPGVRLDQVAFAGGLRCVESRVLGPTGSDHRPVLARFVWAD